MMTVPGFNLHSGARVNSLTPDIQWHVDILPYRNQLSAVCRTKQEAADLVRWFGDEDFCPVHPILLCIPGGWGSLNGLGLASAAELRDEAVARWELQEARVATGQLFDFDTAREKAGLMRREDVDAATREAIRDRVARHRSSPVTDPVRQMDYPNPTNRTLHKVDTAWKDN